MGAARTVMSLLNCESARQDFRDGRLQQRGAQLPVLSVPVPGVSARDVLREVPLSWGIHLLARWSQAARLAGRVAT